MHFGMGGAGDHPYTDIVKFKLPTFWPEIDCLVVEIDRLGTQDDRDHVAKLLWGIEKTGTAWRKLRTDLIEICDRLRKPN
jgi:hypothetical protein